MVLDVGGCAKQTAKDKGLFWSSNVTSVSGVDVFVEKRYQMEGR